MSRLHGWSRSVARFALALCVSSSAGLAGCKKGGAPVVADPGPQQAVVGETLTVELFGSDPDGDTLEYEFRAEGVPEIESTAALEIAEDGHGIFTLTPIASQVGTHIFDFTVSDGENTTSLPLTIEIKGVTGAGGAPVFRKPLSQGTVLDLETSDCVEFEVDVDDPDSSSVELRQLPPTIDGVDFDVADDGLSGSWAWCPDREQREGDDQWPLVLGADDGDNPEVEKEFLIVVRKRSGEGCPGDAPVLFHEARDFSTLLDLEITADITDDAGLKNPPVVLYAFEDPGSPVQFDKLSNVATMELTEGDMQDGSWATFIPNPTAEEGEGATADLWYLISATDNDDPEGDCDHRTDSPRDGVHKVAITNSGEGGAGLCETCSFDVQCGSDADLCLSEAGGSFCARDCSSAGCPDGYVCAPDVQSVDSASGQQCVAESGSCEGGETGTCEDDAHEDDDDPDEAAGADPIDSSASGTLCAGDEDWWRLGVSNRARMTATLSGDAPPDLDLALTNDSGGLVTQSFGVTSDETLVSPCLDPGDYLLRVWTENSSGSSDYNLSFTLDEAACSSTMTGEGDCCEDNNSPGCEDAAVQACTCAIEDFCCETTWDNSCANTAQLECSLECEVVNEPTGCCDAHSTPGCDDTAVQDCVCAVDDFCCGDDPDGEGVWDSVCVNRVGSTLCAAACNPDDDDGPCCEDNGTPGCEINTVEACVCAMDDECCNGPLGWDFICVDEIAEFECGTCPS